MDIGVDRVTYAVILYGNSFIDQRINYIHENPVRSGIIERPEDYIYSSARSFAGLPCLLDIPQLLMPIEKLRITNPKNTKSWDCKQLLPLVVTAGSQQRAAPFEH